MSSKSVKLSIKIFAALLFSIISVLIYLTSLVIGNIPGFSSDNPIIILVINIAIFLPLIYVWLLLFNNNLANYNAFTIVFIIILIYYFSILALSYKGMETYKYIHCSLNCAKGTEKILNKKSKTAEKSISTFCPTTYRKYLIKDDGERKFFQCDYHKFDKSFEEYRGQIKVNVIKYPMLTAVDFIRDKLNKVSSKVIEKKYSDYILSFIFCTSIYLINYLFLVIIIIRNFNITYFYYISGYLFFLGFIPWTSNMICGYYKFISISFYKTYYLFTLTYLLINMFLFLFMIIKGSKKAANERSTVILL